MNLDPQFFPRPLLLRVHPERARVAIVERPFTFRSPSLGLIRVEPGFDTDYASVPRIFWSIYPPDGEYRAAAVVHDWLYWNLSKEENGAWETPITRAQADTVFMEALTALKIPFLRRHVLHLAVRIGGWLPWKRRAEELYSIAY
jgi:regulator of sirC expression with transglutaminase-like and TPR domain